MGRKEKEVSRSITTMLAAPLVGGAPLAEKVYSIEVGYVGVQGRGGSFRARPGGTRTTPGWPDLFVLLRKPSLEFTVEVKGDNTKVRAGQWEYAYRAARRGMPHLIVRSVPALLSGMHYLGLWPPEWHNLSRAPTWDREVWPENVHFLAATRNEMLARYGGWFAPETVPAPDLNKPRPEDVAEKLGLDPW